MPMYEGRIVGVEDLDSAAIAFFVPETVEGIANYILGKGNGITPGFAKRFAADVLNKECKMMKERPSSFVALANTPFGAYVSYCTH